MKIEKIKYWDRFFITPAISVVIDQSFTGYRYLSLSFLKWSLEISWDYID